MFAQMAEASPETIQSYSLSVDPARGKHAAASSSVPSASYHVIGRRSNDVKSANPQCGRVVDNFPLYGGVFCPAVGHTHKGWETRIELPPVLIECGLNDIAVISVPAVGGSDVRYELTRPDGEVVELDHIDHTRREGSSDVTNVKNQSVPVGREGTASSDVIEPTFYPTLDSRPDIGRNVTRGDVINADYHQLTLKFEVFNVNRKGGNATDIFAEYQRRMERNDFMVGPLGDGDLGNWVLSVFCTDSKGAPVELFQVMSFVIVEPVPARASNLELKEGATFEPSFAYPIRGLESCELRGPRASDRPYGRDRALDYCGYAVPNVTEHDQGVWTIVGVGAIVYEATVRLKVHNKSL